MTAANGVFPTAQAFIEQHGLDFNNGWYKDWRENVLTPTNRALWAQLRDERHDYEHGPGADLIAYSIDVERDSSTAAHASYSSPAGGGGSRCRKGGVRFAAYPDQKASEVRAEWLRLAQKFRDAFIKDHARLLP